MAGQDHYVYLSNLGNRDVFTDNSPSQFENRIVPPIQLDPNQDYEVGLLNCLYPKHYYGIPKNDYTSRIEVWAKAHADPNRSYLLYTYVPQSNIEAGDTRYMVDVLNLELAVNLQSSLKGQYARYFKTDEFFSYDEKLRRVNLIVRKGGCTSDDHICSLGLRFGSRTAQVLGFEYPPKYVIYGSTVKFVDEATHVPAPYPPRTDGGVDFALIYADCVTPTRYGGQSVNLLEVIAMEAAGGKDFHQIAYKPLNKTLVDAISIKVTDQNGRLIHFGRGTTMTVLLHIRPK